MEEQSEQLEGKRVQLEAIVQRRSGWAAEVRRSRWMPAAAALLFVGVLIGVPAATYGTDLRRAEDREARRRELSEEKAQLRSEKDRRAAETERLLAPLRVPVEANPVATRIFGELRYYDGTSRNEAWVVVGGVACALGESETVSRALVALADRDEERAALEGLCGDRIPQ